MKSAKLDDKRKKKLILGASGCVAIVIILLILHTIFKNGDRNKTKVDEKIQLNGVYIVPGISEDSTRQNITNSSMNGENCVGNICISQLKITCYSDHGIISYKLKNKGSNVESGYLKLTLDSGYETMVAYKDLAAGGSITGYHGYDGFENVSSTTYYIISEADDVSSKFIVEH